MKALLLLLLASAVSAARVEVKDAGFSVDVPAGWTSDRNEKEDARTKVHALHLYGPRGQGNIRAQIDVERFLPGNDFFKDADAFLKRNTDTKGVQVPGSKRGPVKPTKLAGLPAKRFRYDTFDYMPPDAAYPEEIPTVQETIVASDAGGFWVVRLDSPKDVHAKASKAFSAVLASLKLGR